MTLGERFRQSWIIIWRDLEIYREPGSKGYRKLLRPDRSETIAPASVKRDCH